MKSITWYSWKPENSMDSIGIVIVFSHDWCKVKLCYSHIVSSAWFWADQSKGGPWPRTCFEILLFQRYQKNDVKPFFFFFTRVMNLMIIIASIEVKLRQIFINSLWHELGSTQSGSHKVKSGFLVGYFSIWKPTILF